MPKKFQVQLRHYAGMHPTHNGFHTPMGAIQRMIYAEQVGNFNPIFCRYNGAWFLVHSDAGDTSDPFRRDESYAQSFFICVDQPCQRKTVSVHCA